MLYLDQTRNRRLFMVVSIISTALLMAVFVPGINVVGIMFAAATINIILYYSMPDRYSNAYLKQHSYRFGWLTGEAGRIE